MDKHIVPGEPVEYAYIVPVADGWVIYSRFHHLKAVLRASDGYTITMAETIARLIDGEVVL